MYTRNKNMNWKICADIVLMVHLYLKRICYFVNDERILIHLIPIILILRDFWTIIKENKSNMWVLSYEVSKSDGDQKCAVFFSKETAEKNTVPDWTFFDFSGKNKEIKNKRSKSCTTPQSSWQNNEKPLFLKALVVIRA